jgi:hypothetical protein
MMYPSAILLIQFFGTPWDPESVYEDHNPANHVLNWKTPQLVIHSSRDYRLTESEGLSAFTALQRRGFVSFGIVVDCSIPSRLLIFRNEGHWVSSPKNSLKWHEEVLGWITKWTSHPHAVDNVKKQGDVEVVESQQALKSGAQSDSTNNDPKIQDNEFIIQAANY